MLIVFMKTAFEAFVSIFIISICVLLCAGIIAADFQAAKARDAYSTYCSQLQDSNCASSVVSRCIEDAERRGYTLTVDVVEDDNENRSANISLGFDYFIKMIGIDKRQYIRGRVT